jgi:dienelactone hydrolase
MRLGEELVVSGVVEQEFGLTRDDRHIPGVLWRPKGQSVEHLVLIGHGASGSKRESHVVALARGLARRHGIASAAIDGPIHGDRRGERSDDQGLVMLDFSQIWSSDTTMTDSMVADWQATIDGLDAELGLGDVALGYWGLSMGTILGLPLVAADQRIGACVLGLAGLTGPTADRLSADAPNVHCPTFFTMQMDDELFGCQAVLDLFNAIGAKDKQLHATPGRHSAVTDETFVMTATFLADRLRRGR